MGADATPTPPTSKTSSPPPRATSRANCSTSPALRTRRATARSARRRRRRCCGASLPQAPTFSMVKSYMFDQSAKFVKIYIRRCPASPTCPRRASSRASRSARCSSTSSGCRRRRQLPASVPTLCAAVVPEQCSCAQAARHAARQAAQGGRGRRVGVARRLGGEEEGEAGGEGEGERGQSTAQLLSEMYADADEEGKESLAKAFEEGRASARRAARALDRRPWIARDTF